MDEKENATTASPSVSPDLLPTIRDHAERLKLLDWQVKATIARLHGSFVDGASLNTRMSAIDFEAAVDVTLHGRI